MKKPTDKQVEEFLRESNAIEKEYSDIALQDSKNAWITGVLNAKEDFSMDLMCGLHRRLMKRLNPRIAGSIRKVPVYVGNSKEYKKCLDPKLIKERLNKLFQSWSEQKENLKEMPETTKEMFVKEWHVKFEGIHPFEDGNGRIGRILMNLQRLMLGLPILIIHEGKEQFDYYKWFEEANPEAAQFQIHHMKTIKELEKELKYVPEDDVVRAEYDTLRDVLKLIDEVCQEYYEYDDDNPVILDLRDKLRLIINKGDKNGMF